MGVFGSTVSVVRVKFFDPIDAVPKVAAAACDAEKVTVFDPSESWSTQSPPVAIVTYPPTEIPE
ncbi:MAG: hypothetical protein ACJLS2_02535 [Microcella pacifica]